jgi:hypothetical protein
LLLLPIRKRKKPAAAAAREVIEKEVEFQKNEVAIEGRGEVMKEKRTWELVNNDFQFLDHGSNLLQKG